MSAVLALRKDSTVELGVDIAEVYRRAAGPIQRPPSFEQLYEEYNEIFIQMRTGLHSKQIDRELMLLRDRYTDDIFSVENGFIPEEFGIAKQMQLFDALLEQQLWFEFKGHIYNQPVLEVW